jgi:predicted PurR-regulated permease PerM
VGDTEAAKTFASYLGNLTNSLIFGVIVFSILKGVLEGVIGFTVFGIPNGLFWGMVMSILGILPVVGLILVWFPTGIYYILQGNLVTGFGIMVYCFTVDQVVDNIIYPRTIGKKIKTHPLAVLMGVFAAIPHYGIFGVIIGPIIFTVFLALLKTYEMKTTVSKIR